MANDSNARSQRAKLQPRDKKGWWVDMGKKATWFSKSAGKMKVGTVIATDGVSAWVVPPLENPTHEPAPFRISLKALGMVPAKATIDRRNDKLKAKERAYNKAVANNIFNKSFSQEQRDNSFIFNGKVENNAEGIDGSNPNPNPNRDGNPDPKINKGNDGNPNTFETPEGTPAPKPSKNESPAVEIDKEGNYNVNDDGIPADLEPFHNDLENAIKNQKPTLIKTQAPSGAPLETEITFTEGKGGADNGSVNVVTRDENGTVVSSDTFNPTGDPKNQANQYVNDYKNTVDPQDSEEFLVNLDTDGDGIRDFEDSNVLIKPSSLNSDEFQPTESDLHRARPNETIIQGDTAFVKTDLMTPDEDEDGLWVSYSRQSDDSFVQDVDPKTGKPVLVTSTDLADETPFVRGNTESVRPQEGQDSLFDMPEDAPVEKEKKPRKKKEPVKQPQDQDPEQDALFPDESTQDAPEEETPEADPSKEQIEETPEDESYLFDPKDLEPLGDELVSKYDALPQSTKDVVKRIADSEDERESAMEKLADPETSDEDRKELQDAVDFLDDFDDAVLDSLSPDAESTQDTPEADPSKAVAGVKDLDKVIADTAVKNANPSPKSKEEIKQENDNARAAQEKAARARDERLPAEARQTPTKQEAFVDALDKLSPKSVIQLSDKTMIFKHPDGSLRVVTNPATGALGTKSVSPQSLLKMLDHKGAPVRFADVTPLFEFQTRSGFGRVTKRDKPLGKITVHDLESPSAESKDSKGPEEQKTSAPETPATEGTEDTNTEDREVTPDTFVKDAEEREQEPAPTVPDNEPQGPKVPETRVARMSEVRGARSMPKFTTEELMYLVYDPTGTASKKRAIIKELQRRDPNFVETREMMYADIENTRNLKHDDGRVMQAGDVLWYVGGVLIDPDKADGDTQYALWDYSVNPKGRTTSDVNPMFIAGFAANGNKVRLVPVEDYTQWSLRRTSDVTRDRLTNPDASDVSPKDMSLASAIESDQLGTLVIPRKLYTPDGAQGVDVVIPDEETGRIATNRSLTPILSDGVDATIGSRVRGVHKYIKDKNGKAFKREVEGIITGTPLNNGNVEVEYFDPITGETRKRFFTLQNLSSLDSTLKPHDPDSLAEDATGRLHTQDQFDALQKRMERNRAIPEFLDDDLQIDHTEPQDRKSSEDPTDTSDNTTEDTSEILGDVDKSSVPETGESSDSVNTSKPDDKPTGDSTDDESGEESGGESGEESVEETKKPSASKDRQKDSTPKERQYSRTRLGLPETREEEEEQIAKRTSQSKKEGLFNYYEAAEPYRNEFSRFASNLKKRTFPSDRAKTKFIMENAPVGFRISYPESGAYALKVSPNRWELKEGFGERTWRATTERRVRSLIASKGYDREETNMISPTKGQYEFNYQETMRMKPELANVPVGTKATIGSEQFTKSSETEWKDSSGESTPFADIDTSNESVVVDSIPVKDVLASTLGFSDEALNDAVLFGTNGETLRYNPDTKDWSAFGAEHFDEDGNPSGFSDSDVLDDDEASEWLASNIVSFDNPSDIVGTPDFSYRDEAYNSIPAPKATDHDSILNNSADLPNGSTVEGSISQGGATRPFRAWKDQDGTWFAETQGDDGFFEYDSFPEYQNLADVFTDRPDDYGTPEEGSFTVSVPTQRVNLGLSDSFYPEVPMDRALTDQELDAMIELGHTPVDFSGASLRDVAGVFKDKFGSNPNISWVSDDGHRYAEGDNLPGLRNALGGIYQMYRKYPWLSRPASITALNGDDTDVYGSVTSPTYMRGGRDVNLNFSPHTTKTVGAGLEVEMNNSQTPNVDKHFSNVTDPKTYISHHEMGHVIDGSRKGLSEEDASDQFHRWVADFLGYSLEALDKMNFKAVIGMLQRRAGAEGISRYSVSPKDQRKDTQGTLLNNTTDNINYPEVYAEAVADVEQNGANASAVSKYFFKKLVKDSHDRARYILTKNESPTSLDKLDEFVDNESNGIPVNPLVAPTDVDTVTDTDTETKGK